MPVGRLIRRLGAVLGAAVCLALGALFVYFAWFLFSTAVLPQVRAGGWSLSEDNLILGRHWPGNQLYVLLGVYLLVAAALGRAALALSRIPRRNR